MKPLRLFLMLAGMLVAASSLLACGGGATPTAVPPAAAPTPVPTLVSPTNLPTPVSPTIPPTVPVTVAPTEKPTQPPAATKTPASAPRAGNADKAVTDSLTKFQAAKSFHLTVNATVSRIFFQGQAQPAPGQNPNTLTLFDIQGGQSGANLQYTFKGFMATLLGLFSGFDEKNDTLGITVIGDAVYMNGILSGKTQAAWYQIAPADAKNLQISSGDFVTPMTGVKYAAGSFTKTGSETIGTQNCDVYTANRAAFDAVFPSLAKYALLNTDVVGTDTVDRAEYKVWVCADGNVYRLDYNFDAHLKNAADKKGSFAYSFRPSNYGKDIAIQAPAGATPLSGSSGTVLTTEPTATLGAVQNFDESIEGDWEGINATDSPIEFTVQDNKITYVNMNYAINTGGCSTSGAYGRSVDNGDILNKNFSFTLTNDDGVHFTFAGKFETNNSASGSLAIQGKTFCGDTQSQSTWTAQHQTAPGNSGEEATPTDEPRLEEATPEATTPADAGDSSTAKGVITAFFNALNAKDLDTAAALFGENVIYNIGSKSGIGAGELKSFLQAQVDDGATYTVSGIQDLGGVASFSLQVSGSNAGAYTSCSLILQDGKIAILTIK